MKYGSKTASDTLIGAKNRSERVETVETGLKTGEPSRTAAGASPKGARAVCTAPSRAKGLLAQLSDMWQQLSEPRRAVASGRSAGRSPVRVVVRVTGCGGYWAKTIVGSQLIRVGRNFFFGL